jgi:hypothetical protein
MLKAFLEFLDNATDKKTELIEPDVSKPLSVPGGFFSSRLSASLGSRQIKIPELADLGVHWPKGSLNSHDYAGRKIGRYNELQ